MTTGVRRKRHGHAWLALAGYLLLTLGMTYPLVARWPHIPGDGFDGWQNYWNLWWVAAALSTSLTIRSSPTPRLPDRSRACSFTRSTSSTAVDPAYPAASGCAGLQCGGALQLRRGRAGRLPARALRRLGPGRATWRRRAGVIFTFSPFHFAHLLGHMQVISLEWMPFYALYLLRTVQCGLETRSWSWKRRRPAPRSAPRIWRNGLLAAFFLVLVALCDWYYVLYCMILTAVVVAWVVIRLARADLPPEAAVSGLAPLRGHRTRPTLVAIAAIWLLWAVLLSPVLIPMLREAGQSRFMVPDPAQSRMLSADLLAFVTPQEFHPLWGKWAQEQGKRFTASLSEHQVFAGFTVLALAALGRCAHGAAGSPAAPGLGRPVAAR